MALSPFFFVSESAGEPAFVNKNTQDEESLLSPFVARVTDAAAPATQPGVGGINPVLVFCRCLDLRRGWRVAPTVLLRVPLPDLLVSSLTLSKTLGSIGVLGDYAHNRDGRALVPHQLAGLEAHATNKSRKLRGLLGWPFRANRLR
jgi:hypothetical protein